MGIFCLFCCFLVLVFAYFEGETFIKHTRITTFYVFICQKYLWNKAEFWSG